MSIDIPVGIEVKFSGNTLTIRPQLEQAAFNVNDERHLLASQKYSSMLNQVQKLGEKLGIEEASLPKSLSGEINFTVQDKTASQIKPELFGFMDWADLKKLPFTYLADVDVLKSLAVQFDDKSGRVSVTPTFETREMDVLKDDVKRIEDLNKSVFGKVTDLLKGMKVDEAEIPKKFKSGFQDFKVGERATLSAFTRATESIAETLKPHKEIQVTITGAAQLELSCQNLNVRQSTIKITSANITSLNPEQKAAMNEILEKVFPGESHDFKTHFSKSVDRDRAVEKFNALNAAIKTHPELKDVKFISVNTEQGRPVDVEIKRHAVVEGKCGITVDLGSNYVTAAHRTSMQEIIKGALPAEVDYAPPATGRDPHKIIVPVAMVSDVMKAVAEAIRANDKTKDLKVQTSDEKQAQVASVRGRAVGTWQEKAAGLLKGIGVGWLAGKLFPEEGGQQK